MGGTSAQNKLPVPNRPSLNSARLRRMDVHDTGRALESAVIVIGNRTYPYLRFYGCDAIGG